MSPLQCCGTVIQSGSSGSKIEVSVEPCSQCEGNCAKFAPKKTQIWVPSQYRTGTKVLIEHSSTALTLACCVVFGLPLLILTLLIAIGLVWWASLTFAVISLFIAFAIRESKRFHKYLNASVVRTL